jgi:hypothetical protein
VETALAEGAGLYKNAKISISQGYSALAGIFVVFSKTRSTGSCEGTLRS